MTWIDLGNPVPREQPEPYSPYDWGHDSREYLPAPSVTQWDNFGQILERRRTQRHFGSLTIDQLSAFLWWSCRVTMVGDGHFGFPLTLRPVPSAGAIHPIHLCVCAGDQRWRYYDPTKHAFGNVADGDARLAGLPRAAATVVPVEDGTILVFIAEPGKTDAKYESAESLIWRDAGALIGHMALVAEGLSLNFCPLGITGEPWVSRLDEQGKLVGVGAAILGARGSTSGPS